MRSYWVFKTLTLWYVPLFRSNIFRAKLVRHNARRVFIQIHGKGGRCKLKLGRPISPLIVNVKDSGIMFLRKACMHFPIYDIRTQKHREK